MKQKRPAGPPAEQNPRPAAVPQPARPGLDVLRVCLFSLLLFLAMVIQTGPMTVVLLVLAALLALGREPLSNLRQALSLPVAGFLAFALLQGLAAVYSPFGSYAVAELQKLLASFALSALLLFRFDRRHVRGLLWGMAAVCAVISLVCVDMGSWGVLFSGFNGFAEALGATFSGVLENSGGIRVNGIYNDANVTGALLGPAMLISLHLAHRAQLRWQRAAACLLLGVSAVGFLIAMSRGAILCFCLAALVYLAAEREERLSLFFLMLCTAVALAPTGGLAMLHMEEGDLLPDLLALLCGVLIFLLDWAVGQRLARRLRGHGLAVLAVCLALAVLACVAAFAALRLTKPYTFAGTEGEVLYRAVSLEPGDYTLSGDWDVGETATVRIYSRSDGEALLNGSTVLYYGPLSDGAAFTVPEDAARVFFQFRGQAGDTLRAVTLSDGTSLPMAYKLLPEMIAYRLQDGLLHGHSFLQRAQYLKDGWTLFLQSPLLGHGLGSSEGLLTSVQPFYYQSKYLHNHILQVMTDSGLLGALAFLVFLLGAAWLLLRRLLKGPDSLAAALLACWVMINAHSLMELNFSIRAFQCLSFSLLLLPVLLYAGEEGDAAAPPVLKKRVRWGGLALLCGFEACLLVFGGLYESHRMVVREEEEFSTTSLQEFMDATRSFIRRDVFDHEQDQLNYVANAVLANDARYNGYMKKYAEELRASGTYTACSGLAQYYYLPRGELAELFACSREGVAQEASTQDAWNQQFQFYWEDVLPAIGPEDMDDFAEGVQALASWLEEFNQGRLEEITLTEPNQAFLNAVSSAREAGMSGDALYAYLTQVLGYGQAAAQP